MNVNTVTDLLDIEPQRWEPEPGEKLWGTVVEVNEFLSSYGSGDVKILVILADDGSGYWSVLCARTALRSQVEEKGVTEGDHIGIKYLGTRGEKGYHAYRVRVEKPASEPTPQLPTAGPDLYGIEEDPF
jgi:hypothetical protein